jgi:hypothetical protein
MKSIFVIFGFPYVDQLVNVLSAGGECLLFSTFLFSRKCTSYNNLFILFSISYGCSSADLREAVQDAGVVDKRIFTFTFNDGWHRNPQ